MTQTLFAAESNLEEDLEENVENLCKLIVAKYPKFFKRNNFKRTKVSSTIIRS